MMVIKESTISKAPESDLTRQKKVVDGLSVEFAELHDGEQKKAIQSAIKMISINLNELITKELE